MRICFLQRWALKANNCVSFCNTQNDKDKKGKNEKKKIAIHEIQVYNKTIEYPLVKARQANTKERMGYLNLKNIVSLWK